MAYFTKETTFANVCIGEQFVDGNVNGIIYTKVSETEATYREHRQNKRRVFDASDYVRVL